MVENLYAYIGNDPLTVSIPQQSGKTSILATHDHAVVQCTDLVVLRDEAIGR